MNDFFGIIVYTIEYDGCLNGLWTNVVSGGKIMNEIAKYKGVIEKEKEPCIYNGDYNVTYIETDKKIFYKGILKIELKSDEEKTYYLLNWDFGEDNKFIGKGFIIDNKLIVSYCK